MCIYSCTYTWQYIHTHLYTNGPTYIYSFAYTLDMYSITYAWHVYIRICIRRIIGGSCTSEYSSTHEWQDSRTELKRVLISYLHPQDYMYIHVYLHMNVYWYPFTYTWPAAAIRLLGGHRSGICVYLYIYIQPIAFGVSFYLNLQSQSPWSLFHGPW